MNKDALKECRNRLSLTQDAMASELGVSRRLYIYWEHGQRDIPRYIELACKALEQDG